MHATQSAMHTNRRPRKWYSGAVVLLMGAAISLAACDTGQQPVVDPAAPPAQPAEPVQPADPGAVITDTEAAPVQEATLVPEGEAATDVEATPVPEGEVITDTEGMQEQPAAQPGAQAMEGMGVQGAPDQLVRASTLIGYDFENVDGEVSGNIDDLLMDLSNGNILFAHIEYGGVLGLGQTNLMFPLNAFIVGPEGELVLNFDENALEQYPEVDSDWPDYNDPTWDDDIFTFWSSTGVQPPYDITEPAVTIGRVSEVLNNRVGDTALVDPAAVDTVPVDPAPADPGTVGTGNFALGGVTDVLVNLGTGQAKYVLVDYGTGVGGELYVLPITAFDMTQRADGLIYSPNVTPEVLEQAPRFDASLYPDNQPIGTEFGQTVDDWWTQMGFD